MLSLRDDFLMIGGGLLLPVLARMFRLRLVGRAALYPWAFVIGGIVDLIAKVFSWL